LGFSFVIILIISCPFQDFLIFPTEKKNKSFHIPHSTTNEQLAFLKKYLTYEQINTNQLKLQGNQRKTKIYLYKNLPFGTFQ